MSISSHLRPLASSIAALLAGSPLLSGAEISAAAPGKTGLKAPERVPAPHLAPASDEPEKAMKKFQIPAGFSVSKWAAEPLLGNPVAFSIDEHGRLFAAETYRYRTSTLDIRHYMFMLEDDLASRTTDDRIASIKKNFPDEWQKLQIETEVIRLVEDKDGDGKADTSSEYAAGMNTLLDGINSGVLAHDGKVWCTNMPNLWLFNGTTKDGKAEKRESLSFGYGVRFSFTGHDMHGLILGPDGRLYFSFGDRGAYVKTKEGKTLAFSDEGAVFRCEPDGSHMEAVYRGLRNPQELAFDDQGNLFTGDNDSDQGDRERWVYIVEGGESGWRVGWQHNPVGKDRNPWLAEKIWEPRKTGTPYYVLSPIMNIPDGPSGVAHYPGTGLPAEYADTFFVCGFKGSSARSAITSWKVKPNGADFSPDGQQKQFVGSVQATDVDFGPDSKMYFSEWGEGWEGTGRGRIFQMQHAEALQQQAAQVNEVKKLLDEGFKQRSSAELAKLLSYPDQRIRLQAQWALAAKPDALGQFLAVAAKGTDPLGRLHAIWGAGHVTRLAAYKSAAANAQLIPLLALAADKDAEVRAQTLRILGDAMVAKASDAFVKALKDENLRVRFFAAMGLGKLGDLRAASPLLEMLRDNADKDQFIRHAGVMALVAFNDAKLLATAAKDESPSVRLAVLLAERRLEKPEVAQFLADKDPLLVKEAARAINDAGISGAYGDLAKLITTPDKDEQLMMRVINANFRAGNAAALAKYAADETNPDGLRIEAMNFLASWPTPTPRDRVAGVFRPLPGRDAAVAGAALKSVLPKLLTAKSTDLGIATIDAVSALGMKSEGAQLVGLVGDSKVAAKIRARALETLSAFNDPKLSEAIKLVLTDKDASLRVAASTMLGKLNPDEAAAQLAGAFGDAAIPEKQAVLTALASLKSAAADKALAGLLDDFIAGKIPGEVQLELLEAAEQRKSPEVKAKLDAYKSGLPKGDPLAAFAPTLLGGNKEVGEKLFKEHAVAACLRCHKVSGSGGDAGPDLTGIASKKDRKYLLESMIAPNAQIAEGFQSVLVTLKNGDMQAGVIKAETADQVTLQLPVPGVAPVTVAKAEIKSREIAPSGMIPNLGDLLTKREIRDILEYVASLKAP